MLLQLAFSEGLSASAAWMLCGCVSSRFLVLLVACGLPTTGPGLQRAPHTSTSDSFVRSRGMVSLHYAAKCCTRGLLRGGSTQGRQVRWEIRLNPEGSTASASLAV
ncbi:hypothetical protein BC835DRAFT_1350237 [Cytidiella melzeri]|nr:hypothetical protein BC835DRAFT_1350237 [Cytidiella melzeri]